MTAMDWATLFEPRRFAEPEVRHTPNRNPFQIDQDRIVFSRPFRRLQQKTQVHPLAFNAHVRNRLLHTLEVASVGRSIGFATGSLIEAELRQAGRSADDLGYLVQSVCLAHDIGNPPFGHAGEAVLAAWMARWLKEQAPAFGLELDDDLAHFDGNAQGFRILTRADGYRERGGLRLSHASLAAFLKYPWGAGDPRAVRGGRPGVKFNHFRTEDAAFAQVVAATGLRGSLPRHPAVWLMEAADDLTYTLVDLEDAVELGMLSFRDYAEQVNELAQVPLDRLDREDTDTQRIALLRARAIGRVIGGVADCFVEDRALILSGSLPPGTALVQRLRQPLLKDGLERLRETCERVLYFNTRKVEFEIGARDVFGKMLDVFVPACATFAAVKGDVSKLDLPSRQALSLLQEYHPKASFSATDCVRCAVDFVSGMTDNYAAWLAARLRGLGT